MRLYQFASVLLFSFCAVISTVSAEEYPVVDWIDLMPEDDLNTLLNPPSYLDDIEDGSMEDQISSKIQNALEMAGDDKYQQALSSTKVIDSFNNKKIRIPGFVVPLEFDDEFRVTRFFLVPYFGACIHVPPPPPNQIIYGTIDGGFEQENLYDAYWLTGTLTTSITENDVATSAYSLKVKEIKPYVEE